MLKKNVIPLVVSGPDRRIFLPDGLLDRSEIPEYLTGEVPGE
jgi:light-harvesting complex II chlorophyll a/b binding protein 5